MAIISNKNILLTGAGFTANYGGFLSREMWVKIFNSPLIQKEGRIKELLLENFDFESVYAEVMGNQNFSTEEKKILQSVVETAYHDLDASVCNWIMYHLNRIPIAQFLAAFMTNNIAKKGLIFTLNQDVFIERLASHRSPGIAFPTEFYRPGNFATFDKTYVTTLPNEEQLREQKTRFETMFSSGYIKLHGSYGWTSSISGGAMVIGKNKESEIDKEPLLKWYFELFKNAISEGHKNLLIIGYGFGDDHINNIILNGVTNHELKLFVITPTNPIDFKRMLEEKFNHPDDKKLWSAISGYFPYSLNKICPENGSETVEYKEIMNALGIPDVTP